MGLEIVYRFYCSKLGANLPVSWIGQTYETSLTTYYIVETKFSLAAE